MVQLAIRGHVTRGNEVIELLEMLGGKNDHIYGGNVTDYAYIINEQGVIDWCIPHPNIPLAIFTLKEFLEKFPYKVGDKVQHKGATSCGSIYEVEKMRWEADTVKYTLRLFGCNYKTSTLPAEYLQPYKEETMEEKGTLTQIDLTRELCIADEVEVILGDYEFVLKDGKTYFVKKKPQYPKTYEECCNVLGVNPSFDIRMLEDEESALYFKFIDLVRCRNAYWKIAGEPMRLGEPWKPNWAKADERKYCIVNTEGNIARWVQKTTNKILAFPTEEMRDAFYENFKDLIESCKELL